MLIGRRQQSEDILRRGLSRKFHLGDEQFWLPCFLPNLHIAADICVGLLIDEGVFCWRRKDALEQSPPPFIDPVAVLAKYSCS